jgi:hypothetical protein
MRRTPTPSLVPDRDRNDRADLARIRIAEALTAAEAACRALEALDLDGVPHVPLRHTREAIDLLGDAVGLLDDALPPFPAK